jgi:hypothetical protein
MSLLHSGSADGEPGDSHWNKIFRQLLLGLLFVIHIPYAPPYDALSHYG